MKPASFELEADTELVLAVAWYEERQPGRGDALLQDIKTVMSRIVERPRFFPQLLNLPANALSERLVVRRAILPRFPFGLIFVELEQEIRIIALAHLKRAPNYWFSRIQ